MIYVLERTNGIDRDHLSVMFVSTHPKVHTCVCVNFPGPGSVK